MKYFINRQSGAASAAEAEEVGWDEESDDEAHTPNVIEATPVAKPKAPVLAKDRLEAPKPHDVLSQPDSEASYDFVSAATSKAGGSPRQIRKEEESEEEDWE